MRTETLLEILRKIYVFFPQLSGWQLMIAIFFHNLFIDLNAILLGLIIGIVPFLYLIINGFIIGIVIKAGVVLKGWKAVFFGLFPHGIFEIPALILTLSSGFLIGFESLKWLLRKESQVKNSLKRGLRIFFKLIVPLLFLASLTEVFVTSLILEKLIK